MAGGDNTDGSCASVALAYVGQKQGWNVLDFRDGKSREFFSSGSNLYELSQANGLKVLKATGGSSVTVGNRLLQQCEEGHEYYLCVGRHAAIVGLKEVDQIDKLTGEILGTKSALQYLELQSPKKNGWKDFGKSARDTLTKRFGCI